MVTHSKLTKTQLWNFSNKFCKVNSVAQLGRVLHCSVKDFKELIYWGEYRSFEIPKKSGGLRPIEDPDPQLKSLQKNLNFFLQSTYYLHRTEAVYGFVMGCQNDPMPRNIYTNAQQHLGNSCMYNLDFKDFFHHVSSAQVADTFQSSPFAFNDEVVYCLTNLTTHQGRLPMGAATSPALSNFVCRGLDHALLAMAKLQGWTFTRYADDLTFSGNRPFSDAQCDDIKAVCREHGFVINPDKEIRFLPHETKVVTGLQLTPHGPDLPDDYLPKLQYEISQLRAVHEVKFRNGRGSTPWLQRYQQRIRGAMEFVKFVKGQDSDAYQQLSSIYEDAMHPADHYDPVHWLDFGYA